MFVTSNFTVGVSQRVVATLVACATVLLSMAAYHTAQAANFTSVSNTLSDSTPSVTSAHTIEFTIPAGGSNITVSDNVTITFPTGEFTGVASVATANVTVSVDSVVQGGATASAVGDVATVTNFAATAGQTVEVAINDGIITNPSITGDSESFRIDIASSVGDSGSTMVAIVNPVTVTASVDTQFTFIVSGTATSTAVNGATTDYSTGTTTIDFGEISAGTQYTLAQDLSVLTNAINGFSVTVETDGNLRSANGADIDTFENGNDINAGGSTWAGNTPAATVGDEDTYGHWGMTYTDTTLNGGVVLAANEYIAASTTPRQIFYHNGPADGTLNGTGTARVGYSVQISALQEAADDYTSVLTYIATPTF